VAARVARVVVADDHPLFVEALRAVLEQDGIEILGSTGRGDDVVRLVAETSPDVLLLDLAMPRRDGLECLAEIRQRFPEVEVIVVSADDRPDVIECALGLGAVCFVGKTIAPEELTHAIRVVADRSSSVIYAASSAAARQQEKAAGPPAPASPEYGLTKREREILSLVVEGHSNAELARMLWVTEQTVKFHLSNIYRKLSVANRTQAAAKARGLALQPNR
jgi:DNA-binding NarL/FixJ family response regulator